MLAIAGCSEDNTHPKVSPVDEPSADAVTILATIDAIPSATGDGEAYAPLWQEGDQIVVGYKGISYVYETYDAGNGVEFHPMALSLPADARGEVTAYFKAVDGVFAVGADQTGATLPMYAYAADAAPAQGSLGLHFKPLASVLSLTIGEEASKTISKITLEPVDPDGVEGHLAVSEAVVDPRTGAVTVGEDAAVSDILTMEIGEMSLVQAQTVNFLIASGTKVDGGLKATISCTDGSVFVKNLFEGQEVAFAGNCVGAATELFFRLRIATYEDMVNFAQECADDNGGAIVDLQADIDMRSRISRGRSTATATVSTISTYRPTGVMPGSSPMPRGRSRMWFSGRRTAPPMTGRAASSSNTAPTPIRGVMRASSHNRTIRSPA